MNTLADYGDESDDESPRRRSFNMGQSNGLGEVPSSTHSQENTSVHSPKTRRDSDYSPRPRRDSDAMFDDTDTMFDEPRRYSSFSDNSEHSENTEFREPPPPKRKEYHSPSPSLPTPTSKIPQVSSGVSLVSYGAEDKEDAFERADRAAEKASSLTSPPSGIIEPRPPERISQQSDTDDENERLIDMALEDGRNAMKQIEDGSSTGSGGWTPRPYDTSPFHGMDQETDTKRIETPPHQDVTIPLPPTTECDPELVSDVHLSEWCENLGYVGLWVTKSLRINDCVLMSDLPSSSSCHRARQLLRSATHPKTFSYIDQLTTYIRNNVILHEPGRFLIIPKPYGVSCVGTPHEDGGVFESSVYNRKVTDTLPVRKLVDESVTISDCIFGLARLFNEPNLSFCTGLKRYLSGAIVLPANSVDFENVKKSIKAILISSPPRISGSIYGYATFQSSGNFSEYIFVEKRAERRARMGKFAIAGSMDWKVLAEGYGCSLVEFTVNKFARHLPRVMFSHMLCPILGDEIYGNRLIDIDGKIATVQPKDLRRAKGRRIFPRFGWVIGRPRSEQDFADLYANTPPPPHFLAMVEALGMSKALMKYFHENNEDKVIGGDERF
ncbi:unnamed protein product [Angiostrongylus costaricensis]|uniref:RNA-dependent RNA polymerase n=1 Tax=Angiostrongylus costaricensis TaxID=334426 RepID=A0A158PKQ8_ANGCS|nr:unnamed protein product [Angiostrongylus costaricensis]